MANATYTRSPRSSSSGGGGGDSPQSRRPGKNNNSNLSAPWSHVVRGDSETIPAAQSSSPSPLPLPSQEQVPDSMTAAATGAADTISSFLLESSSVIDTQMDTSDNVNINVAPMKKPAWNKPSIMTGEDPDVRRKHHRRSPDGVEESSKLRKHSHLRSNHRHHRHRSSKQKHETKQKEEEEGEDLVSPPPPLIVSRPEEDKEEGEIFEEEDVAVGKSDNRNPVKFIYANELEEEGLHQGAVRQPSTEACDPTEVGKQVQKKELTREQREYIRFMNVQRKKDFICLERVRGKMVNVLAGLELHCGVFSAAEQKRIVDLVLNLQEKGKNGDLKAHTYTAPKPWMRGKGRVTIQFGCCYNYAMDKKGNPPGILRSELVDPIPHLFKVIIRRMVQWHVLPPSCVPDSCIVNIYEEGNCIPPHIDSHDFVRPFCTVSFLSECNIVFGSTLRIIGHGDFSGSAAIPLPVGSVLVLQGNGADVAKHCVPAVQSKRISITFRKMDESKRPIDFIPEADLQGIQPLAYDMDESNVSNHSNSPPLVNRQPSDLDESKMTYPPPPVNRKPVTREYNSERRRGFPGRGSRSEPRHSTTPNRQPSDTDESKTYPLNSSPQVNRQPFIRESSSERRKEFLGRGSESEPRYSTPPNNANRQPVIRDRRWRKGYSWERRPIRAATIL